VRKRICNGLEYLGLELDEARNVTNGQVISASNSQVTVHVIHTDEELMIARSVSRVLGYGRLHDDENDDTGDIK